MGIAVGNALMQVIVKWYFPDRVGTKARASPRRPRSSPSQ
jgi:hypothetical protein